MSSTKCLVPREVIASGNSAIFLFLSRVTFLTSRKHFSSLLEIRKSNLVLFENFTSVFILSNLIKFFIFFKFKASKTSLFVNNVLIPTKFFSTSIISREYFNFLLGLFDSENQVLLHLS